MLLPWVLAVSLLTRGKPEEPEEAPRESVTKQVTEVEATSMHLRKKEGQLGITDGDGKDCPPRDNLGLYSGYHLLTQLASYAWIGLDDVKLAKMDENSEMGIRKEGKDLTLFLSAGGVFFNVTEPLPEDETLNIRCSSMGIGIRGTCGWVQMTEDKHVMVYLLEGNVECKVTDGAGEVTVVTVSAGEVGDLYVTPEGAAEVEVLPFAENYVAPFVMDELTVDPELSALVLEVAGLDVLNPPDPVERLRAEYQEIIDGRTIHNWATEGLDYAVLYDLDQDGTDELILDTKAVGDWGHGFSPYDYESEYDDLDYDSSDGCPTTKLEIYGDKQGHAAKLDELFFPIDEYGFSWNRSILLTEKENQPYIFIRDGDNGADCYSFSERSLSLADSVSTYNDVSDYDAYKAISEVENLCPKSPADDGYENWYLGILCTSDQEESLSYAKLIDMNHDGIEDLLYSYGSNSGYSVRLWNGSEIEEVSLGDLDDLPTGYEIGLYREKSTGDGYVGTYSIPGIGDEIWNFNGVSDYATYSYDYISPGWYEPDEAAAVEDENAAKYQAMHDEIDARFELIEELPRPDDYEAGYATVNQTIDQLLNQIREKYPS